MITYLVFVAGLPLGWSILFGIAFYIALDAVLDRYR